MSSAAFFLHDQPDALRFEVRGRLDAESAAELVRSAETALSIRAGRPLLLDLRAAEALEASAREALQRLAGYGAQFLAAGEHADELRLSLRREPRPLTEHGLSFWKRMVCRLFHWIGFRCACLTCAPRRAWLF